MNTSDEETKFIRQRSLLKMAKESFQGDSVKEYSDGDAKGVNEICSSWGILIQKVDAHQKLKVFLEPTEEFLTDMDVDFNHTCKAAISKAADILERPHFVDNIFQGKIMLSLRGVILFDRK